MNHFIKYICENLDPMNLFMKDEDNVRQIRMLQEEITRLQEKIGDLQASDEKLRLILDNIPQRVFWKDIHSVYLGCNKNFARAAGVDEPESIVGKTDYDLAWARAEADAFRRDDREVMDNDCPKYHILESQKQADGGQSWLDTNKIPLHDAEGRVIGILGTYEDITDRKRAGEQLEEAKQQAELYLDLISHDIGNMNQAMLGYLEMALDSLSPGDEERFLLTQPLEIVRNSSRLIDNVRKLKRLQSGEIPSETLDLGQVLSDVKASFSGALGREVTINYLPVRGYMVEANAMLKDLFANMIDNAVRHSQGKLIVDIEINKVAMGGQTYYRVDVADNGPGISDQLKGKLLFAINDGTGKAERRGIGLLLIKKLLDRFHGYLRIEDRVPGDYRQGARFVVLLPARMP
jgi:PAS domain S-box-containing protein